MGRRRMRGCLYNLKGEAQMRRLILLKCLFLCFVVSCAYRAPTPDEMESYSAATSRYSEDRILRELDRAFAGGTTEGRGFECRVVGVDSSGIQLRCVTWRTDTFGRHKYDRRVEDDIIDLCDPTFEAVRQVPLMSYYFYVNGVNLGGNKGRAMKAYNLLRKWCE